jgi:tetratricopeptide (TPR) repeat protein
MTWVVLALALGASGYFWFRNQGPRLPEIKRSGIDPAIVKAIGEASAEVRKSPASGSVWGRLGMMLYVHDFFNEADRALAEAERLEPPEPRWPYLRGLTRFDENPAAAIPFFQRAADLCGDSPAAPQLRLAETLLEYGRTEEAETNFQRVLLRNPKDARALLGSGGVAAKLGRLQESLEYLKQSIEVAPTVKASQMLIANVYQRLGDVKAAEQIIGRAAALPERPDWPDPFLREAKQFRTGKEAAAERAVLLLELGRAAETIALLQETTQHYPDYKRAWLLLGKAHSQQHEFAEAETALRKAVQLSPDSVDSQVELGVALYNQGSYAEAEARYREAIRLKPNLAEAHYNIGLCLWQRQVWPEAIEAFRTAVRCKPDLTQAYVRLGEALAKQGQSAEAVEQFNHALRLNPSDAQAQKSLQTLQGRTGGAPLPK